MKLLFFGDVVGKGGREALKLAVPELRRKFNAQFVIVNGENSAAGAGLSGSCLRELSTVADVVTGGDHVWDQKGFETEIREFPNFIRPANLSTRQPGKHWGVFQNPAGGEVAVISLLGKVFMRDSAYCPFETVERIVEHELPPTAKTIVVDFHAEATSEKIAMAHFLDGKVTAVLGTHTHVRTADARILPGGTAAVSDVGMCGAESSVLGREIPAVLKKFRTGMPVRLPVVEKGIIRLDGVLITYDGATGRASEVEGFSETVEI